MASGMGKEGGQEACRVLAYTVFTVHADGLNASCYCFLGYAMGMYGNKLY